MPGLRLAIMQPYLFPYVGYFQLFRAVDRFVFYDDVAYIKQGWINRNRLLVAGEPSWFTVPLSGASSFNSIAETQIDRSGYDKWRRGFVRTIDQSYARAPRLAEVRQLVESVLDDPPARIAELAIRSVTAVASYLGIDTATERSSESFGDVPGSGQDRVIGICRRAGAVVYVNAVGGKDLYTPGDFDDAGVQLQFHNPDLAPYRQQAPGFEPGLSILDLLLNTETVEEATNHLTLGALSDH